MNWKKQVLFNEAHQDKTGQHGQDSRLMDGLLAIFLLANISYTSMLANAVKLKAT